MSSGLIPVSDFQSYFSVPASDFFPARPPEMAMPLMNERMPPILPQLADEFRAILPRDIQTQEVFLRTLAELRGGQAGLPPVSDFQSYFSVPPSDFFPAKPPEAAAQTLQFQKAPHDSHSLFYSMATLLMNERMLPNLLWRAGEFQAILPEDIQIREVFLRTLDKIRDNRAPSDILSAYPDLHKGWITFLRFLAVDWWAKAFRNNEDSALVKGFLKIEGDRGNKQKPKDILSGYIQTMSPYNSAMEGRQREILALKKALGIQIRVVYPKTVNALQRFSQIKSKNPDPFLLVRSPGHSHYDTVLPRR